MPGSTFRYGSSFCITTRRPRALSSMPRLEAVRPLPSEEATPPVTKMCLVVVAVLFRKAAGGMAKRGLPWSRFVVRCGCPARRESRVVRPRRRRCGSGVSSPPVHGLPGYQRPGPMASGHSPHTSRHMRAPLTGPAPVAHPFGAYALPGGARTSSTCVVSCSDTRCRARPATRHHPPPVTTGTSRARQFVEQRLSFGRTAGRRFFPTARRRITTTP